MRPSLLLLLGAAPTCLASTLLETAQQARIFTHVQHADYPWAIPVDTFAEVLIARGYSHMEILPACYGSAPEEVDPLYGEPMPRSLRASGNTPPQRGLSRSGARMHHCHL